VAAATTAKITTTNIDGNGIAETMDEISSKKKKKKKRKKKNGERERERDVEGDEDVSKDAEKKRMTIIRKDTRC
jgi:hypothetical protein